MCVRENILNALTNYKCNRRHFDFAEKIRLGSLCESIHMKCHVLFSQNNNINNQNGVSVIFGLNMHHCICTSTKFTLSIGTDPFVRARRTRSDAARNGV